MGGARIDRITYGGVVIVLHLYLFVQCLKLILGTLIKNCNFVTFYEFLIHLGMHHTGSGRNIGGGSKAMAMTMTTTMRVTVTVAMTITMTGDDDDNDSSGGRRATAATDSMVWGRRQAAGGSRNENKAEMETMWV